MARRKLYSGSSLVDPLTIDGLQLYMNKSVATPSSFLDQSPNAFNFIQPTVTKQPTITATSVNYDSIDDNHGFSVSNVYSADTRGVIFVSGYFDNSGLSIYLSSADTSITTRYFYVFTYPSGELAFAIYDGVTPTTIRTTTQLVNGSFFRGYIYSDSSSYLMNLNGNNEVLNVLIGSNDGRWLSSVSGRDNLVLGKLIRTSTAGSSVKLDKIIYTNDITVNRNEIDLFMSDPNN